jgi:hypothetical protein
MSDLPCNLDLSILPEFGQEEVTFRTDVLIPQPIPLRPVDNAHICLTADRQASSHILLSWTTSVGANVYVLQWSESQDMQGASLHQKVLLAPTYTLIRNEDIQLGQTIYWRVFALNTVTGGVSLPSVAWQLTYACPQTTNGLPTKEATFNVMAEMIGPDFIRHCEDTTYYLKLSYTGFDANEREIFKYESTEWAAEFIGDVVGTVDVRPETENDLKVYLNTRLDENSSANVKLTATVTFTDMINEETFTKEVTKEILSEPFTYGCNLKCVEECITDNPEEKTFKVAVDLDSMAGDGLKVYDRRELNPEDPNYDPCACPELQISIGCNLKIEDIFLDRRLSVDLDSLAGPGLTVIPELGGCPKLAVDLTAGCGISIDGATISVNHADLASSAAYTWSNVNCPAGEVFTGCSTGSGLAGTAGVVQAQGLVYYNVPSECPKLFSVVNIPYNCTLTTTEGGLGFNLDIIGKGLTVVEGPGPDYCPEIQLCVDTMEDAPPVIYDTCVDGAVDLDECSLSAAEKGIAYGKAFYKAPPPESEDCGELLVKTIIPVGCHFNLANGKIELDLTALAGANLSIDDSGSCPKLKADLGDLTACELPEILGLCSAPVVTPTTSMFVLGLQPDGLGGCCLVKFAITECPPPGGEPEPDPGPI